MMKRYNEKKKDDYEIARNVILNAILNSKRKVSSMIPLFEATINNEDKDKIKAERRELFGE